MTRKNVFHLFAIFVDIVCPLCGTPIARARKVFYEHARTKHTEGEVVEWLKKKGVGLEE